MTFKDKHPEDWEKCSDFFNKMVDILKDTHEVVPSCNNDASLYLVPKGTANMVTYSGKPLYSLRISDHWNWYANKDKNPKEWYIQCFSEDIPFPRKRDEPGKGTTARPGIQVCVFGQDMKYHCVYGYRFDRKSKTDRKWIWKDDITPNELAESIWTCMKETKHDKA